VDPNYLNDLGVGSYGAGEVPLPLYFTPGEFNKIRDEIDRAVNKFWEKDQIRGWDEKGNRIGTGIPRVRPNFIRNNEYAI
jgi:hypothetical protein